MKKLLIITPVKDSIDSTVDTMEAIVAANLPMPHRYIVFNDNSTPENTVRLHREAERLGVEVVDLSELTDHPSPNYLFVLRRMQQAALAEEAALAIVESDVTVRPDTLLGLWDGAAARPDCGIAASVTVDAAGSVNYPYDYARKWREDVVDCRRHCSFCCSLLTPALLKAFDFGRLDEAKNWFDVTISHESIAAGLHNYLFLSLPVLHRPHASRPWKQLKYKNPLLYYWRKWTKGFDKI